MINVDQITSRLAKLPDQQLQQYAQMHKTDPYIMALAVAESNRRKQMRASAQAGPAQEQPKVADQALAGMAPQAAPSPEESGIAALPAGNMNFADGGIVAFADGGDVERYSDLGFTGTSYGDWATADAARRRKKLEEDRARNMAAVASGQTYEPGATPAPAYVDPRLLGMTPPEETAGTTPYTAAPPAVGAGTKPSAGLAAIAPGAAQGAAPGAAQGAPTAGAGKAPASAGIGAPSVQGAREAAGQFLDTKSLRSDLDKFYATEEAAANTARARREEGKPGGEAFSKAEAALQKEEAGAADEKKEAMGVAIFKAGLGMMAGASPHAFENIGKGAMAGLEEYTSAMKDMKKAAKERQKAFAEIENARRAESRDDWKAKNASEDKRDEHLAKAREFGVKGIMDITGKDAEIASGIYKTQVTEAGATNRANIQAGATITAAGMRGDATGSKQQLAELKALQSSLSNQLKTEFNKDQRAAINAQLSRVNAEIANMAGLGTMAPAPGAARPGGTRPPLSSFQR